MPNRTLYFAKIVLCLAGASLCGSWTVFAIVAIRGTETASAQVAALATKLNLELDEVHRLTLEAGLTAMEARKASVKESAYLDQWNSQLAAMVTDANRVLIQAGDNLAAIKDTTRQATAALAESQKTIKSAQPALASLNGELSQLQDATTSLDELISDPNIGKTIANFETTSENAAVISTDGREVVERYAHPTKKKLGFWGGMFAAARIVSKISPPLF
jgi:uncharacterized phage infection (PIP) family protein YhgE